MEPIISGSTTERLIRTSLAALMFTGFSVAFIYDGLVRYPRQNVETVLREAGMDAPDPMPGFVPGMTKESVAEITGAMPIDALMSHMDGREPLWTRGDADNGEGLYFAPAGFLRVATRFGQVVGLEWGDGPRHTAMSLLWQKAIGFGLAPISLVLLYLLVHAATTRVRLDDTGLQFRGTRVPFEAMNEIRAGEYSRKGWVHLEHGENASAHSLKLDSYHIAKFRPIIQAICDRKGWKNPLPPPRGSAASTQEREEA